jgi:hypothetical protein
MQGLSTYLWLAWPAGEWPPLVGALISRRTKFVSGCRIGKAMTRSWIADGLAKPVQGLNERGRHPKIATFAEIDGDAGAITGQ